MLFHFQYEHFRFYLINFPLKKFQSFIDPFESPDAKTFPLFDFFCSSTFSLSSFSSAINSGQLNSKNSTWQLWPMNLSFWNSNGTSFISSRVYLFQTSILPSINPTTKYFEFGHRFIHSISLWFSIFSLALSIMLIIS